MVPEISIKHNKSKFKGDCIKNILKVAKYAIFAVVLAGPAFQAKAVERDITSISDYADTMKAQARYLMGKVSDLNHSIAQGLGLSDSTTRSLATGFFIGAPVVNRLVGENPGLIPWMLTLGFVNVAVTGAIDIANELVSKRSSLTRAEALQMAEEAQELLRDANDALGDVRVK